MLMVMGRERERLSMMRLRMGSLALRWESLRWSSLCSWLSTHGTTRESRHERLRRLRHIPLQIR